MTAKAKSRRSGRSSGILVALALLMMGSGIVRLMGTTGQAIANEVAALTEKTHAGDSAATCDADPQIADLLRSLREREADITSEEARLKLKESALAVSEERVLARLEDLKSAEEKLAATMTRASSASEDDLAKLTAVYESMKPKDAAALFQEMSPEFAAGFLARMRSDAAAAVVAGLKPETAYLISVILAGRNANVPKPEVITQ